MSASAGCSAQDSLAVIARLVEAYRARHPEEEAALAPLVAQLGRPERPDDRATLPGHLTAAALLLHPARRELLLVHHRVLQRWLQPGGHLERGELPAQAAQRELVEETGVTGALLHGWHAAHALPAGARPAGALPAGALPSGALPDGAVPIALRGGALLPLDIDIHAIPANPRKAEPAHLHLDFRYVFVVPPARASAEARVPHAPADARVPGDDGPVLRPDFAEVTRLRWTSLDALAARDGSVPPVDGLQRAARKLLAALDAGAP